MHLIFYIFIRVKFLSLIFGLVIQPTVALLGSQKEEQEVCSDQCCSDEESCNGNTCDDEKSDTNDCCPGGICNPFEQCACCFGFSVTKPTLEITSINVYINYIEAEIKKLHYGYSSDCFHPPKIV